MNKGKNIDITKIKKNKNETTGIKIKDTKEVEINLKANNKK